MNSIIPDVLIAIGIVMVVVAVIGFGVEMITREIIGENCYCEPAGFAFVGFTNDRAVCRYIDVENKVFVYCDLELCECPDE